MWVCAMFCLTCTHQDKDLHDTPHFPATRLLILLNGPITVTQAALSLGYIAFNYCDPEFSSIGQVLPNDLAVKW